MPEWWTYRLSDFLMFSAETFFRLFARVNHDAWPIQILLVLAALALPWLLRRGDQGIRAMLLLLAAAWLTAAWFFHWQRFREIHLAAGWYAGAFALQGLLLGGWAVAGGARPAGSSGRAGLGVYWAALGLLPVFGRLLGRPWIEVALFGLAPDPTAVATLGLLIAVSAPWPLLAIPFFWCVVSVLTLATLGVADAWLLGILTLAAAVAAIRGRYLRVS